MYKHDKHKTLSPLSIATDDQLVTHRRRRLFSTAPLYTRILYIYTH